jgi:membrane protease YdiL (CAAX protease family)
MLKLHVQQPTLPVGPAVAPSTGYGRLDAKLAAVLLCWFLLSQLVVGFLAGAVILVPATVKLGSRGASELLRHVVLPLFSLCLPILGMSVTLRRLRRSAPEAERDTGPTGAALSAGRFRWLAVAFAFGSVVAGISAVLVRLTRAGVHDTDLGPVSAALHTPGFPRAVWAMASVFVAPLVEEVVLRGVAFGGFCRSWGRIPAVVVITALDLALHSTGVLLHHPGLLISFLVQDLLAVGARLRFRAVGPAVALHAGHNLMAIAVNYHLLAPRFFS